MFYRRLNRNCPEKSRNLLQTHRSVMNCLMTVTCVLPYLSLHHRRPLCAQHFDGLEDVDGALVTHPLQHDTESDEHTCAPDARTAQRERQTLSVCVFTV